MDQARRQRVEDIFEQVVDLTDTDRRLSLAAACAGDADLAADVERLLEADAVGHRLLDQDAAGLAGTLLDAGEPWHSGARFGAYVIRRELGHGGMGSVFLAEREELGDLVALKFLHDAWSSPARRERFASEQRTLAGLSHRYIARLYDAGVTGATPWFAMEYIAGTTIVAHCRDRHLGLRERLRLFRAACEAVSYAHRHLVVHLDLKPSNVLVNADGEVKLVDFGIARHLVCEGGDAERTATGQRLLSLNYASPEQIGGETLNVQTDLYALGVILYELLTGRPPVDLANTSVVDLLRLIQEDPPPPSAAAADQGGAAVPASRSQWHDLNLLCLTALHRDKTERYQTVDRLIEDVDRFLNDEPIEAHHGNRRLYLARKFLWRNRRGVAAAAAAFAAIAALSGFYNVRLIAARDRAISSEARMQRVSQLMLNLFEGDDSGAAGPSEGLRVVSLLDRGAREAEGLRADPELQAEMQLTVGGLYHKLGHLDRAEPLLVAGWSSYRATRGDDDPRTTRAQLGLAMLRVDQSRFDEAERLTRSVLDNAKRRQPDGLQTALAGAALGKVLESQGHYREALPLLHDAVGALSAESRGGVELSEALGDLANTLYYIGDIDGSEAVNRRGLALDRELFGERHPNVAVGLYNLGNIQLDRGRYAEAEQLFRQALDINTGWYGSPHPKTASDLLMLGRAVAYQGHLDDAAVLYQRAMEATRAVYPERHPRVAVVLSLMGDLARERNLFDDAEAAFRSAASIFKDSVGEQHEFYQHQLSNLGSVFLARGRYQDAERVLRTAVDGLTAAVPGQRYTGLARVRLATALGRQHRYAEAEPIALAGYETLRGVANSPASELQDARRLMVEIYEALNQPARADSYRDVR